MGKASGNITLIKVLCSLYEAIDPTLSAHKLVMFVYISDPSTLEVMAGKIRSLMSSLASLGYMKPCLRKQNIQKR